MVDKKVSQTAPPSTAFDGGHAKRINFNGVVHKDAIEAARTITATYLD
jgi:hypothetical protein